MMIIWLVAELTHLGVTKFIRLTSLPHVHSSISFRAELNNLSPVPVSIQTQLGENLKIKRNNGDKLVWQLEVFLAHIIEDVGSDNIGDMYKWRDSPRCRRTIMPGVESYSSLQKFWVG